jgi:RXT2-like, N-terminal
MPSQQVEVHEAIAGIKRALKREREGLNFHLFSFENQFTDGAPLHPAPSDQPVLTASNRGNKLRQGAKFVHEGSLIHVSGPEVYKQVRKFLAGHAG